MAAATSWPSRPCLDASPVAARSTNAGSERSRPSRSTSQACGPMVSRFPTRLAYPSCWPSRSRPDTTACCNAPGLADGLAISVMAQGFVDAALGEFVLARDALGVDAQQHVHAVPGPFGHLGGIDAAVQPRRQAGVPQVVWPPGQRRGLLGRGEGQLACLNPGTAVGDGGQFAAPHTGEETAVVGRAVVR